jgi:threonine aldolase
MPIVPERVVDLRSDTVTRPTPEMRSAMASADVGDDGYGEDPTVNRLEERYAALVEKPAALFVPSGTMANQIAVRVLSPPGTMVLAGRRQHVVAYERGAVARNASVQLHPVDDDPGWFEASHVAAARAAATYHQPTLSLVCVEDTHMAAGGVPWSTDQLDAVVVAAAGVPIHMDGARLFNAQVATGLPAACFAARATTVMSCLSKGLCAPVGSLLAGPVDVMREAREERKRLGGSMRQCGVLAAAGLLALELMVDRLADDHRRARRLAEAVAHRWPGAGVDPDAVATNMVVFAHPQPGSLLTYLRTEGVLAGSIAPGVVRLVTHHDVDDEDVDYARRVLEAAP